VRDFSKADIFADGLAVARMGDPYLGSVTDLLPIFSFAPTDLS
jgi:hypothetical protein